MEMLTQQLSQNNQVKSKLVNCTAYSHISLTLKQTGLQGEFYNIGVLLFRAAFTIERVFESQQGEGAIITGKVIDTSLKPCMVVLNRGDPNLHCIIGPNRIYYDATNGDDYKVHVPNDYLGMPRHSLLSCTQPLIEIYGVQTSNRDWKNAHEIDFCSKQHDADQRKDPAQMTREGVGYEFRAFQVPSEDFKGLAMQMTEALSPTVCLLDKPQAVNNSSQRRQVGTIPQSLVSRLENKTFVSSRQQVVGNSVQQKQQPEIKKTRSQLLKEQNAAQRI